MKELIMYALGGFYLLMTTLVFYLAVMNLKRNRGKITKTGWFFMAPIVVVGVLVDVALNILVGTVIFLEPPKEWVYTDRLQRHLAESSGWRLRRAAWFCEHILDPFDPSGKHC